MNIAIDFIGALLAAISGYLYIKKEPVAWLISLAAIPFDMIMDFTSGIYGDLLLQLLYFALLLYGWFQWRASDAQTSATNLPSQSQLIKITGIELVRLFFFALLPFACVFFSLNYFLGSQVALLDSIVTVSSVMGIWLLSRKIVESWLLWIAIDILYVLLFSIKFMPFHALTALFDAGICTAGYWCWIREYNALHRQVVIPSKNPELQLNFLRNF